MGEYQGAASSATVVSWYWRHVFMDGVFLALPVTPISKFPARGAAYKIFLPEPEHGPGPDHIERLGAVARHVKIVLLLVHRSELLPQLAIRQPLRRAFNHDLTAGVLGAHHAGRIRSQVACLARFGSRAEVERPHRPHRHHMRAPIRARARHPEVVSLLQALLRPLPGQQPCTFLRAFDPVARHMWAAGGRGRLRPRPCSLRSSSRRHNAPYSFKFPVSSFEPMVDWKLETGNLETSFSQLRQHAFHL